MPRPEESATQSAGENRCPTARLLVRDWRMNAAPEPPVLSGSSAFSSAESRLVTKSIREDSPDLRQPTKLTHPPQPPGLRARRGSTNGSAHIRTDLGADAAALVNFTLTCYNLIACERRCAGASFLSGREINGESARPIAYARSILARDLDLRGPGIPSRRAACRNAAQDCAGRPATSVPRGRGDARRSDVRPLRDPVQVQDRQFGPPADRCPALSGRRHPAA